MTTPWDIYAEQLFPVGYGHPLWIPETNIRELEVGDIGWLKQGEFRVHLNSMRPQGDPVNMRMGVPPDFVMFNPANVSIGECNRIVVAASAGAGFNFQPTSDSGAFLLLEPPGQSRDIESKRHIVNYMREHFDGWIEWANGDNSWGLDLEDQDLIFVCGTIKSTRWAVAAFQGNIYQKKEGHVSGEFGPFATVVVSLGEHTEHATVRARRAKALRGTAVEKCRQEFDGLLEQLGLSL